MKVVGGKAKVRCFKLEYGKDDEHLETRSLMIKVSFHEVNLKLNNTNFSDAESVLVSRHVIF